MSSIGPSPCPHDRWKVTKEEDDDKCTFKRNENKTEMITSDGASRLKRLKNMAQILINLFVFCSPKRSSFLS